jgi:Transposase, Mutator family
VPFSELCAAKKLFGGVSIWSRLLSRTESQAPAAGDLDGRDQEGPLAAFDAFVETWGVKYDKAVECLIKDRDALLAFYDFPAEHWKHLRTTNVVESSFATVRGRITTAKLKMRFGRVLPHVLGLVC